MARKLIIMFENVDIDTKKYLITRSNPSYWKKDGVRNKFDYVFAPSYPDIEKAYHDAGKKIFRPDSEENADTQEDVQPAPVEKEEPVVPMEKEKAKSEIEDATESTDSDSVEQSEPEDAPTHWSELSWPQMRSKASELTDEPISSKDKAKEVLQNAEDEGKI